jgi:hypothetical protein
MEFGPLERVVNTVVKNCSWGRPMGEDWTVSGLACNSKSFTRAASTSERHRGELTVSLTILGGSGGGS